MAKSSERTDRTTTAHERFLPLPENKLALAALQRLMRRNGKSPVPGVYLYGPSGCGKSHLVRQFVREARQADPSRGILSLTASELADQFAAASEKNRIAEWREGFRRSQLFVCEEIHALARRPETQRILVSILEDLHQQGGQVVLTADRLPGEIGGLQPRLLSRCRAHACTGLRMPEVDSRVALLSHFASSRQIAVTPTAIRLIAESRPLPPRELQAIVIQLEAAGRQEKCRLDADFARRFLQGEVTRPKKTLPEIGRAVARHFGVRLSELRSPSRTLELATPRQCAMFLGRRLTGESLLRIAEYFGRKNHTAVLQACRRTSQSLREEPALRRHLTQIGTTLGAIGIDRDDETAATSDQET